MAIDLVEMEYSGPDGHVQDEVAPYNDGNRRVYAGDKVAIPEDLAEYLNIFEGWNFTSAGKVGEDDTVDVHAEAQQSIEKEQVGESQDEEEPAAEGDDQESSSGGDE